MHKRHQIWDLSTLCTSIMGLQTLCRSNFWGPVYALQVKLSTIKDHQRHPLPFSSRKKRQAPPNTHPPQLSRRTLFVRLCVCGGKKSHMFCWNRFKCHLRKKVAFQAVTAQTLSGQSQQNTSYRMLTQSTSVHFLLLFFQACISPISKLVFLLLLRRHLPWRRSVTYIAYLLFYMGYR